MFWSKLSCRLRPRTLKARMVLAFAVWFAISSLAIFILIYLLLRSWLLAGFDSRLRLAEQEFRDLYLTGGRSQRFGRELPLSRLPRRDRELVQNRFPDLQLLSAYRQQVANQVFLTMLGARGDRIYELRAEPGGGLYSRELNPATHLPLLQRAFIQRTLRDGRENTLVLLRDSRNGVLTAPNLPEELAAALRLRTGEHPADGFTTEVLAGRRFRLLRRTWFDGSRLELGFNCEPLTARLLNYVRGFWLAVGLVLIPATLGGWLLARRFTAGLNRIGEATHRIAAGDLSYRVPTADEGSEIEHLAQLFNQMNANTERLLNELKTVTDNVAHDLRTPLTRMKGELELTLSAPEGRRNYPELCGLLAEECDRLIAILNTMLEITRTNAGHGLSHCQEFRLDQTLAAAHELLQILAEEKELDFRLCLPPEPLLIRGDELKIQRLIANLAENAIKFTPPGGRVELELSAEPETAIIRVRDTGCGIAPEDLPRLFERFFRADASRHLPGNGLGLALVQAIAHAHGGRVEVASEPGRGTVFTVFLPQN